MERERQALLSGWKSQLHDFPRHHGEQQPCQEVGLERGSSGYNSEPSDPSEEDLISPYRHLGRDSGGDGGDAAGDAAGDVVVVVVSFLPIRKDPPSVTSVQCSLPQDFSQNGY